MRFLSDAAPSSKGIGPSKVAMLFALAACFGTACGAKSLDASTVMESRPPLVSPDKGAASEENVTEAASPTEPATAQEEEATSVVEPPAPPTPPSLTPEPDPASTPEQWPNEPRPPGDDPADQDGGVASELERCLRFDVAALSVAREDANCDATTPEICPDGSHMDYSFDHPCGLCSDNSEENRTCDWARACFEPFLHHIAYASGAKRCESPRDCSVTPVSARCGAPVLMALHASINEELPIVAKFYDRDNCSLCGDIDSDDVEAQPPPEEVSATCQDGVCILVDDFEQL